MIGASAGSINAVFLLMQFDTGSYGGSIEGFTEKGVLGALLDVGGGALLYVFVTHMAAFSELSGSQVCMKPSILSMRSSSFGLLWTELGLF